MHPDVAKNSRYNNNQDVHSLNDSSFETQVKQYKIINKETDRLLLTIIIIIINSLRGIIRL
jgi:hypothetical protein